MADSLHFVKTPARTLVVPRGDRLYDVEWKMAEVPTVTSGMASADKNVNVAGVFVVDRGTEARTLADVIKASRLPSCRTFARRWMRRFFSMKFRDVLRRFGALCFARRFAAANNNDGVSRFYDRVHRLYPLVDLFCGAGRRRLIEHINREPSGRLLDVGVGPGRHLRLYRGHRVVAIDCSPKMVASSRARAPGMDVRLMDGERLAFAEASFDYVALSQVLSVTADPARMLAEIHRVLRPGGRVFIFNHETPENGWRHVERLFEPVARALRFRSWFRVTEIRGVERFRRQRRLGDRGVLGVFNAYCLER